MEPVTDRVLRRDYAPILVPVHNLGAGGNTPPFWLPEPQGLGWRHVLFNAYFLRDSYRASMLGDIHAWVDSGGFLFLEAPQRRLAGLHGSTRLVTEKKWSEDLVELVLKRQERFGTAIAFTLDYPIPPRAHVENCCPRLVYERQRFTAVAAGMAYQLRSRASMKLLVVLHYTGPEALEKMLALLARELRERAGIGLGEVDGYAVGGLVPHSGKWWLLARRLQEARTRLGWDKWLHLLGVASPHNLALLYAAGADSMDSKTYIIAAAKRLYYNFPGEKPARIPLREARGLKPRCICPACRGVEDVSVLATDTKKLALHNLYVSLAAAREAGEACREGRLEAYLARLAEQSPRLRKALGEIRVWRKC